MLRHAAEKNHLRREKNKSIQTDIVGQYHNYHHLIHSSFYVSSHFCLKIQTQSAGYRASETVLNSRDGLAVKDARLDPADPRSSSFGQQIAFCVLLSH